jgi:hypothetical protein
MGFIYTFFSIFWRKIKTTLLPLWLTHAVPDPKHFSHRRLTTLYQRRTNIVKMLWLFVALVLMLFPFPAFAVPLCLFISFVSFSVLDEHQ